MLRRMLLESRLRPWLLTLFCVALLVVHVGGAHLHLCFDGSEPPSSLHLMDSGLHHAGPGADAGHQDVNLALAGEALTKLKLGSIDLDLPVLLIAALLVWSLLQAPRHRVPVFSSAARILWPPLRGPPLLTSH